MREFALCFCVVIGLCVGAWYGNKQGSATERATIAGECRTAGAFTHKRTGFNCQPIKKPKRVYIEQL
jgi:hypothetical protein